MQYEGNGIYTLRNGLILTEDQMKEVVEEAVEYNNSNGFNNQVDIFESIDEDLRTKEDLIYELNEAKEDIYSLETRIEVLCDEVESADKIIKDKCELIEQIKNIIKKD